jgi:thiamine pyrophosphate-dependent acetolactate synthase large subunit-like protein
MSRRR